MKRFTIAIAAILVLAAACSSTSESTDTTTGATTATRPPIQAIPVSYGLQTFNACDDFLDYVKTHAVDLVGPYGFDYGYGPFFRGGFGPWLATPPSSPATRRRSPPGASPSSSSTSPCPTAPSSTVSRRSSAARSATGAAGRRCSVG